jgi:hypothetical protein
MTALGAIRKIGISCQLKIISARRPLQKHYRCTFVKPPASEAKHSFECPKAFAPQQPGMRAIT